jgi:dihydrofolate reductase
VAGGADTIVQYLNAGLVDELEIGLAPVLFGGGTSLIGEIDPERVGLEISEAIHSPRVTHLRYKVHASKGAGSPVSSPTADRLRRPN